MTTTLIQSRSDRMAPNGAGSEPALLDIIRNAAVIPLHSSNEDHDAVSYTHLTLPTNREV